MATNADEVLRMLERIQKKEEAIRADKLKLQDLAARTRAQGERTSSTLSPSTQAASGTDLPWWAPSSSMDFCIFSVAVRAQMEGCVCRGHGSAKKSIKRSVGALPIP